MEDKFQTFGSCLLKWYFEEDKRTFPWRKSDDPYKILMAEIMLQRTKAEQVSPVWQSFIQKYPSPIMLKQAKLPEIEIYFSKLGLLWRAKTVHALAERLSVFKGRVPSKKNELLSLPGIGDYVSDAVLCFAFGETTAILDSNVCRVLGRVFNLKSKSEARRNPEYRKVAEQLVPKNKCREYNWALIDLANEICTPQQPKCSICPLNMICNYFLALKQKEA